MNPEKVIKLNIRKVLYVLEKDILLRNITKITKIVKKKHDYGKTNLEAVKLGYTKAYVFFPNNPYHIPHGHYKYVCKKCGEMIMSDKNVLGNMSDKNVLGKKFSVSPDPSYHQC